MQSKNFSASRPGRAQRISAGDGTDFVRCRTCGKHLSLISGRHLYGTNRETYIEEYALSPDKLCSKSFRINHSSRSDYCAHSRREWIAAMKVVYKRQGMSLLAICRTTIQLFIPKECGYSVIGT